MKLKKYRYETKIVPVINQPTKEKNLQIKNNKSSHKKREQSLPGFFPCTNNTSWYIASRNING